MGLLKRTFDLLAAGSGLIILSPLFLLVAIGIKMDSQGPVFYRAERIGKDGKPFRMYKFRSMVFNADKIGGTSTSETDIRITRVGAVLRRWELDEFPQLINVVKGEMSLVGPRPEVEEYTSLYSEDEKVILSVQPGMTDYASIKFIDLNKVLSRSEDPDYDYKYNIRPEKNRLRMEYALHHSFWIDMQILWLTFVNLVTRKWNIGK